MTSPPKTHAWTFLHPMHGPGWYASAWGDGAGTLWLTGVLSLGRPSPIARSTDGGRTWSLEAFTSRRNHTRIRGVPGGAPWVAGYEGMLVTLTKGRWKRLRTGLSVILHGLWCASPEVVFVCGGAGTIASTRDAGRTFAVARCPTEATLYDVRGDGAGSFVAVGEDGVILRGDDGARWDLVPPPDRPPTGAAYRGLKSLATWAPGGFLAAGGDALLRSDDGGRTWRDATPKGLRNLTEVFVSASGQWFVGSLERIVRSDDRGASWCVEHAMRGPMHRWVYALHVEADGSGVAVGPHNTGYLREPSAAP
jgi:photosystem II stability/assembly factor-like uncharacterized protein